MKKFSFLILLIFSFTTAFEQNIQFKVHLDSSKWINKPVSGRLLILMDSDTTHLPLYWPNYSDPQPAFGIDIKNLKPGESFVVDSRADFWKHSLDDLNGYYAVSALFDIDTTSYNILAAGNLVSEKQIIKIEKGKNTLFDLTIKYPIQPFQFKQTDFIKEIKVESPLLTTFYKTPTYITGAVILPQSYWEEKDKRYTVVFVFPGWGGNRFHIPMGDFQQKRYGMNGDFGKEKIFVFMDQDCRYGYHVFANSAVNGLRGDSFVKEFLPEFDKLYRTLNKSNNRFLVGQSSGAWASLWLQINYPDYFGGTFVASPDPVDFRFFENAGNIYDREANFYYDVNKKKRNHYRPEGKEIISNYDYMRMEAVYGDGWQMRSYESVFSNKDSNGKPMPLFDRKTGAINHEVSEAWKKYDISLIIKNGDKNLLDKLSGKIHIYISNDDDYYLNLAVEGLKDVSSQMKFDIDIQFLNGLGHNVWTDDIRKKIHNGIDSLTGN